MMQTGRLLTALVLGAALPPLAPRLTPPLAAQDLADVCRAMGEAKLGQWTSYDLTAGRSEGGKMRLAAVGSERVGDSTFFWFEMHFTGKDPSHDAVIQVLTPGLGPRGASIHGVIMKAGTQPAMKLSDAMLGVMGQGMSKNNPALEWGKLCTSATVVGWESVTVPAGTLRALHIKSDKGDDAWVSRDVPFAIVKVHGQDGTEFVLTGRGADARSSITEKPQEMSLPGMMPKP